MHTHLEGVDDANTCRKYNHTQLPRTSREFNTPMTPLIVDPIAVVPAITDTRVKQKMIMYICIYIYIYIYIILYIYVHKYNHKHIQKLTRESIHIGK